MPTTDVETMPAEAVAGAATARTAPSPASTPSRRPRRPKRSRLRHLWSLTWPKLAAIAIGLFLWQCVVWSGWKPEYLLPGPAAVFSELWSYIQEGRLQEAMLITFAARLQGLHAWPW